MRAANPRLKEFEASCFDGYYVTGDITADYLSHLARERDESRDEADESLVRDRLISAPDQAGTLSIVRSWKRPIPGRCIAESQRDAPLEQQEPCLRRVAHGNRPACTRVQNE